MKGTAYLVQGTLVALWWLGLSTNDSFYNAFQFPQISNTAFNAFFVPDFLIIVVLSFIRGYRKIKALEYIILGGFAYGSLYCLNTTFLTSGGFLPTTIMFLGLCYNLFLVFDNYVFREANNNGYFSNGIKTFFQILCIWSITLVLFPWIILDAFGSIPTPSIYVRFIAIALFILSSTVGLSSAYTLVKHGQGTPLPADQTQKLVINGPYRYIRNPMALAGMGQGVSLSIYFGSTHILAYTVLGGILWQLVVRPLEEKNMIKRFGETYNTYRKNVSLWIPKIKNKKP